MNGNIQKFAIEVLVDFQLFLDLVDEVVEVPEFHALLFLPMVL